MFYWLYYMRRLPYEDNVARYYRKFPGSPPAGPNSPVLATVNRSGVKGLIPKLILAVRYRIAIKQFHPHWRALLEPGQMFESLASIPKFPNPHIRSNGFMVRRDRL